MEKSLHNTKLDFLPNALYNCVGSSNVALFYLSFPGPPIIDSDSSEDEVSKTVMVNTNQKLAVISFSQRQLIIPPARL